MRAEGEPAPSPAELFLVELARILPDLMKRVNFGAAAECFNPEYWERPDPKGDTLRLRKGKSASKAIDQLVSYSEQRKGYVGKESAKLDCVEIIEVARWCAQRAVIGDEAFDKMHAGSPFLLDAPGSTGVVGDRLGERAGEDDDGDDDYCDTGTPMTGAMIISAGDDVLGVVDLAKHLSQLPIGSRVMWRTFDPNVPREDDFKNENTLKIGEDLYAAHPLGLFTLAQMSRKVAEAHYQDMRDRVEEAAKTLAQARKKLEALNTAPAERERAKDEPDPTAAAKKRLAKRIRRQKAILGEYEGIGSLDDYVARFVRVVETETFVNPCA